MATGLEKPTSSQSSPGPEPDADHTEKKKDEASIKDYFRVFVSTLLNLAGLQAFLLMPLYTAVCR